MKKLLYFAFGSNLLTARLFNRIGLAPYKENYRLKGYKLTFDCQGFANIQPDANNYVDGSLYDVTPDQISILNRYEALYNANFFDYNKDTLVVVYIGKEDVVEYSQHINALPSRDYLEICMEGMQSKGLFKAYEYTKAIYDTIPIPVKRSAFRKQSKKSRNRHPAKRR